MSAIHIHTRLESDTPHLPQLKPLVGKSVEITVVEAMPASKFDPGHGNWDAVAQAARELIAGGGFDVDAQRQQDELDLQHANDHLQ